MWLFWVLLFIGSEALGERISVCPHEHVVELSGANDVKIIVVSVKNVGTEEAFISLWANDTFNNPDADPWQPDLTENISRQIQRRINNRSAPNVVSQVKGAATSLAPNNFLIHLTPETRTPAATASAITAVGSNLGLPGTAADRVLAPRIRGSCVVSNQDWNAPVSCQLPAHRADVPCKLEINEWSRDVWRVNVPQSQNCTVAQVNEFISQLAETVPIAGLEEDMIREVEPIKVQSFTRSSGLPPSNKTASIRTTLAFDPTTPPNEWYYRDLDYPFVPWLQMNATGQRQALAVLPPSAAVTIMVIDTMVELGHPDLASGWYANAAEIGGVDGIDDDGDGVIDNKYGLNGENIAQGDPQPAENQNDHGVSVASVIIATPNNDYSVAGLAPHLRVLPCSAGTNAISVLAAVECMRYATQNAKRLNIRVVNHSFSGYQSSVTESEPFVTFFEMGLISTVATGNIDSNLNAADQRMTYPYGYLPELGLHTILPAPRHDRGSYSECGYSNTDMGWLVQGSSMLSKFSWTGVDIWGEGTSFAAPTQAAIVGSMLSVNPRLDVYDIRWILRNSLELVPGFEKYCRFGGFPNMDNAIRAARGTWLTTNSEYISISPGETKYVEFVVNPSLDIDRLGDVSKLAYIVIYGQDTSRLTNVYKIAEIPVKINIRG